LNDDAKATVATKQPQKQYQTANSRWFDKYINMLFSVMYYITNKEQNKATQSHQLPIIISSPHHCNSIFGTATSSRVGNGIAYVFELV
jgi:hypothetical protein